jgi:zinc transport system substrate-binding protein
MAPNEPPRAASAARPRRRAVLGCGLLLPLAVGVSQARAAGPLRVAVSILPQKQLVERVGGEAVDVMVLVRRGQSPHSYEPTPQQMVSLARADLYFCIGVDFERAWLPKIQQTHPRLRAVDTREGIRMLAMVPSPHEHPLRASGARPDPHIWTSPPLVKRQAQTIRDALIELRPTERARFEDGYARYAAELDQVDTELRRAVAGKARRSFLVFHPAWGYLADSYGLEQIPIELRGKEPGPQALAAQIERARAEGIRVIFVQQQFSRAAAEAMARAIDGEVVELDPLAEDLIANTRVVAQALARALQ